jgi:hypothetical protein
MYDCPLCYLTEFKTLDKLHTHLYRRHLRTKRVANHRKYVCWCGTSYYLATSVKSHWGLNDGGYMDCLMGLHVH